MTTGFGTSDSLTSLKSLRGYTIIGEVGRGGMGIVYEAIENALSRRVALKILPPAAALDPRQLARFRNETLVAGRLDHPQIVPVYFVGCQNETHYYTMKFIEGRSLKAVIADLEQASARGENVNKLALCLLHNPLPQMKEPLCGGNATPTDRSESLEPHDRGSRPAPTSRQLFQRVAELGIQAADSLHYAHTCGITHGDVKPVNLLLDIAGQLWLADYGLSQVTSDASDPRRNHSSTSGGTLNYLSPEQARGETDVLGSLTDIYSLGATLFELITLRPAVAGQSSGAILTAIAYGPTPRASQLNASVPLSLDLILCGAMANDPAERYQSAAALSSDLRRFLDGETIHNLPNTSIRRRSVLRRSSQAGLFAAVVIVMAWLVLWSVFGPWSPSRAPLSRLSANDQTWRSLRSLNASVLPRLSLRVARGEPLTADEEKLLDEGRRAAFVNSFNSLSEIDEATALVVDQLIDHLLTDKVDVESFIAAHPAHAATLRELLPALRMMADLSQSDATHGRTELSAAAAMPGDLGDFRLLRQIGQGGMGVVYEADQTSAARHVAVKILPFASLWSERALERFRKEVRIAAMLEHPHIVPIYTVGCERGIHFFAMKLIDGCSLADVIRRR